MKLKLKRIYDKSNSDDGYRVLVDRLWPRGVSKEEADLDLWLKQIAPSTLLRKWYSHDPSKWNEFKKRYDKELIHQNKEALQQLQKIIKEHNKVTLLYASKSLDNNAKALYQFLIKQKGGLDIYKEKYLKYKIKYLTLQHELKKVDLN